MAKLTDIDRGEIFEVRESLKNALNLMKSLGTRGVNIGFKIENCELAEFEVTVVEKMNLDEIFEKITGKKLSS